MPSCWSQPAPRPRYQPSLAIAGVDSASAATPAKAIMRIFIFPSLKMTDVRRGPPNVVQNEYRLITALGAKVSIATAQLEPKRRHNSRFYSPPVSVAPQADAPNVPFDIFR